MACDFEFYVRRLLEERQAASVADSPEAKERHMALAASYLRKAHACAASEEISDVSSRGAFASG